jgi:hypothetical protein
MQVVQWLRQFGGDRHSADNRGGAQSRKVVVRLVQKHPKTTTLANRPKRFYTIQGPGMQLPSLIARFYGSLLQAIHAP